MIPSLANRKNLLLWQVSLLVVGTSWLWAPYLNSLLSYRVSLISQYEAPAEPFSWLFRGGDLLAGLLILLLAVYFLKNRFDRIYSWLLLALSIGLIIDPLFSTSCRMVGQTCQEYFSAAFLIHAIETTITAILFVILAVYDNFKRKKIVSLLFIVFQIGYSVLFISQWANQDRFNTFTQFVYQTILIVWLAWLGRDLSAEKNYSPSELERRSVKVMAAGWAYLNGILAIVISLAHLNLLGRIKGLYFTGDSAWLAQHGIIVGVIMIYLARHLARGEARARQIFLLLAGIETLKYSVISPHAGLMLFYFLTFIGLFLLRDDFDRGTLPLTWTIRLKDLFFLVSGLLLSAFIALVLLDRDNSLSLITFRATENFSDYVFRDRPIPHAHLNSALLAHSLSVFLAASLFAVFWVLFRPYKAEKSAKDFSRVEYLLTKYSKSSEDFFKLWPKDKEYYWGVNTDGFIAYKIAHTTVFVLADPIGAEPKKLLTEFINWCKERRLRVCALPIYPKSLPLYEAGGLEALQIGSSALITIPDFLDTTVKDKWWRWRINKAQKAAYSYHQSTPPHSSSLLKDMRTVSNLWLSSGGHAERAFAMGYFDEAYLQRCIVHYLLDANGRLVAFANQLPQFSQNSLLTIDLFRSDPSTESMAYLLFKVIEWAAENGYNRFDLGFVPFAKARGPLLRIAKTIAVNKFSAKGLEQFKNKFNPSWEPNYLAYDGDVGDLGAAALSIEKVMTP